MAISMGKTGSTAVADINMTPMIDVLLVLLVIFILVQMNVQRTFDIQLPVDAESGPPDNRKIVLEIDAAGAIRINTLAVGANALEARLRQIFEARPDKLVFLKADPAVPYADVIDAIDAARAAGVKVIGAILPPVVAAAL